MRRSITHLFVQFVPDRLEDGVLYISTEYATVSHKCLCGCGKEVVTPLSPTDWTLTFDGETIGLDPSVGNWSLPCRSHYWIRRGRVQWCGEMRQELIDAGRVRDRRLKDAYYSSRQAHETDVDLPPDPHMEVHTGPVRGGYLSRVITWLMRRSV